MSIDDLYTADFDVTYFEFITCLSDEFMPAFTPSRVRAMVIANREREHTLFSWQREMCKRALEFVQLLMALQPSERATPTNLHTMTYTQFLQAVKNRQLNIMYEDVEQGTSTGLQQSTGLQRGISWRFGPTNAPTMFYRLNMFMYVNRYQLTNVSVEHMTRVYNAEIRLNVNHEMRSMFETIMR